VILRPTLLPGLPRVWRGPHTLQLGADPARALLIDLPDPRAAGLLDLLDGTRPERVVLSRAAEHGLAPAEARALLDTLHAAGFVLPGPRLLPGGGHLVGEATALALHRHPAPARTLRRRAATRVVITGRGRLGAPVALALAEAGVGHVQPDLPGPVTEADLPAGPLRAEDIGRVRGEAVASALARATPEIDTRAVRRGAATLTVQLGYDQPTALLAAAHAARAQPHLALAIREAIAVIGPFVPATGAPCLNCVDLHRRDRDTGWSPAAADAEPCTVATLLAATAYATAEVLTFLDGGSPETMGATVEISTPGRFRRRTWRPHPRCDCGSRRPGLFARHAPTSGNPDG
jgi:ThiF family protein